jgi:hypothetical protein
MLEIDQCRVFPKESAVLKLSDMRIDNEPHGTLSSWLGSSALSGFVVACVLIFVSEIVADVFNAGMTCAWEVTILLFIEVVALTIGYVAWRDDKNQAPQRHKEKIEKANKERIERANLEALNVTRQVLGIATSYQSSLSALTCSLSQAENSLKRAKTEYEERTYASFWDNVDLAAEALVRFNESASEMRKLTCDYAELLSDRTHDFPALAGFLKNDPDPRVILYELAKLVRLGQSNFRFAMIWEQRATREALIEEFSKRRKAAQQRTINHILEELEFKLSATLDFC